MRLSKKVILAITGGLVYSTSCYTPYLYADKGELPVIEAEPLKVARLSDPSLSILSSNIATDSQKRNHFPEKKMDDTSSKADAVTEFKEKKTPENQYGEESKGTNESRESNESNENIVRGIVILGIDTVSDTADKMEIKHKIRSAISTKVGDEYNTEKIQKDIDLIINNGFAKTVKVNASMHEDGSIYLYIDCTSEKIISNIEIKGSSLFDGNDLKKILASRIGSVADEKTIQEDTENLQAVYGKNGYVGVVLGADYSNGTLTYQIAEAKIEKIQYIGDSSYRDLVSKEVAPLANGGYLRPASVQDVRERLIMMGFESVDITASEGSQKGNVVLTVSVGAMREKDTVQDGQEAPSPTLPTAYNNDASGNPAEVNEQKGTHGNTQEQEKQATASQSLEISSISLDGNTIFNENAVIANLQHKVGDLFDAEKAKQDMEFLAKLYADNGFVSVIKNAVMDAGKLIYHIMEAKIEDIVYSGNTKTKDWVIDKFVVLQKGWYLRTADIQATQDNLVQSGYFSNVNITAKDGSKDGNIILNIDVTEAPTAEWSIGTDYNSEYKGEITGGIKDINLGGTGKTLGFSFGLGKERKSFDLKYTDPFWRQGDTKVYADIYRLDRDIDSNVSYREMRTGGSIGYIKPISKDRRTTFYNSFGVNHISVSDASEPGIEGVKDNILTFGIAHNNLHGQNGSLYDFSISTSQKFLGSENTFTKFQFAMKNYQQVSNRDLFASRLELNYSPNSIPYVEQFSLGGSSNLRALDEDAQRGDKSILASLEWRHGFTKNLESVLFVDAGKAWSREIKNSLKVGFGAGLRIKTAMGMLRLDAAKTSGESVRYMFGIGQAF